MEDKNVWYGFRACGGSYSMFINIYRYPSTTFSVSVSRLRMLRSNTDSFRFVKNNNSR